MLAIIFALVIVPADTVTGRVTDNAGQPIASAIVEVPALGRSVTTGSDGTFRLIVPAGRYTVSVRRQGYSAVARDIAVYWRSLMISSVLRAVPCVGENPSQA